jgi:polysaccharide pyruvyl transferase WcaK-like protein
MNRIALLNVKYSPNLGDGIIAECLEHELSRIRPEWQIQSVDLAAREWFGSGLGVARARVLGLLDVLPSPFRRMATISALLILIQLKYRWVWRRQLVDVTGVIVGGGQLFADSDLNFPLKVSAALGEARQMDAQLAVFGVGVSERMSKSACRLFLNALNRFQLSHVAVRDNASRYNWNRHFGRSGVPGANLCCDPGLLAADVYRAEVSRKPGGTREIGIGIVNPRTLDLHSRDDDDFSFNAARDFLSALTIELLSRDFNVTLFTNGPHDDEVFLESVFTKIDDPRVKRMPAPLVPQQLTETIRAFDAIIAHRLHANILAYAFRIPHVGLSWDLKMEAFFESVGRRGYIANHTQSAPDQVADLIEETLAEGIDSASHAAVTQKTRDAISICAEALAAALLESKFQDTVRT